MAPKQLEILKPRFYGTLKMPDDLPFEDVAYAVLLLNGASPNARVKVLNFTGRDTDQRGVEFDMLQKVTVLADDNGDLIFRGESYRARHEMKLADPFVEYRLVQNGRCQNCGYA